jgi:hypothetical protein
VEELGDSISGYPETIQRRTSTSQSEANNKDSRQPHICSQGGSQHNQRNTQASTKDQGQCAQVLVGSSRARELQTETYYNLLMGSDTKSSRFRVTHPALKAAFEAAYPPQHPNHKDLVTISFGQFLSYSVREEMFILAIFQDRFEDFRVGPHRHLPYPLGSLRNKTTPSQGISITK